VIHRGLNGPTWLDPSYPAPALAPRRAGDKISLKWVFSKEPKVYGLVCNLTAAMVLAHTLLGCCWHHHHTLGDGLGSPTSVDRAGVQFQGGECGHGGRCGHRPAGADHSHRGGCQGGHCVFATGEAARMFAVNAGGFWAGPTLAAADGSRLSAEWGLRAKAVAASRWCPPLRIHLSQQVLLL
jgi:hypothetical protein